MSSAKTVNISTITKGIHQKIKWQAICLPFGQLTNDFAFKL
jgi:hypothetical protein